MTGHRLVTSSTRSPLVSEGVLLVVLCAFVASLPRRVVFAAEEAFDILPWTDGIVYYKFDDGSVGPVAVHADDQAKIENEMATWEQALTLADPSGSGTKRYIDFRPCGNTPRTNYLLVRYNHLNADGTEAECNNMPDPVGMEARDPDGHPENENDDGVTELHFRRGTCPAEADATHLSLPVPASARTNQPDRIILHELGHALGFWHEFNREDADRWLIEVPDEDGDVFADSFGTKAGLMPALGNYDYDSIMHYGSGKIGGAPDYNDYLDNTFDKGIQKAVLSERDKSRLLQYLAHERYPNWGFFKSLSSQSRYDPDELPDPYLVEGVEAMGTPAIAYQSPGNYTLFARGSDNCIYCQEYWTATNNLPVVDRWRSIGSRFSSDPAAVSRAADRYDVVAVNDQGDVQRIKYIEGVWYEPLTIRGGHPTGGLKQDDNGNYIGPAIASRGANLLEVFVVRSDGRLAVTTWSNNTWGQWRTLDDGYDITAQPAAVALSDAEIQLAINESHVFLYEPLLTFAPLVPSFSVGIAKAATANDAPPAIATRGGQTSRYRVLIANSYGRISHRTATGDWMEIGGILKPGTGPAAVATGDYSFRLLMNGEDATGCDLSYSSGPGRDSRPGGLWIRDCD
ncbi:MAG: hypothetical protein KBE65_16870 [Phycisphaerae bacterium]|nr:hypothetical protein [Phycisphaerae bacterium]